VAVRITADRYFPFTTVVHEDNGVKKVRSLRGKKDEGGDEHLAEPINSAPDSEAAVGA
jgi:hypothetical protein